MRSRTPLLTLAAISALALSLAGCSASPSSSAGASAETSGDTLEQVKDEGTLVVGTKFDTRPFGFVEEGASEPVGFDIDIAREFADRLGVELELVQVTSQNRMLNLETGKVDMLMASMIRTAEREETIDFSIDYFSDSQLLLVPAGSSIASVDDLDGKTVALAQGGAEEANIKEVAPGAQVLALQSWPDALQAMLRGEADAVTSTLGLLSGLVESADEAGVDVEIVGESIAEGPVGAGFRKGDDELREAFNDALVDMANDGTYDEIFEKWWADVAEEPFTIDPDSVN